MLRLFDTARGEVVPVELREAGKASMYVCGPTVYGPPHLGHGRFALVFDILRRYLEWSGLEVTYVSNITDVDDNIIQRGHEEKRTPEEVAAEYEAVWYEAMDAIGVKRPDDDPHASAYVDRMVEVVQELEQRGVAYETSDGVYFVVDSVDGYGLLARQDVDTLRSGARVEVGEEKRSPLDFVLWKKAKPGEPSWDSPWGPGRPGWHTECVVMSLDLLGEGFDIHGGGQDLMFPHHENERAQAVAMERPFARHWAHNGFVEVGGEKMSKSLGNFVDLLDLVESSDPRAYRLLVLQAHYRSPVSVSPDTTAQADAALRGLDALARRAADLPRAEPSAAELERFRERMDDDLDTPGATAVLFGLVTAANSALDAGRQDEAAALWATVQEICAAVGLEVDAEAFEVPDAITTWARERDQARASKDFERADELRDRIQEHGWVVEDTPGGTTVRPS